MKIHAINLLACFFAMVRSRFGVTVVPPQLTTLWAEVKYLAYVRSRNEVEVTYCMLLSLILNKSPPVHHQLTEQKKKKKTKLAVTEKLTHFGICGGREQEGKTWSVLG